jgi:hypothetical protein
MFYPYPHATNSTLLLSSRFFSKQVSFFQPLATHPRFASVVVDPLAHIHLLLWDHLCREEELTNETTMQRTYLEDNETNELCGIVARFMQMAIESNSPLWVSLECFSFRRVKIVSRERLLSLLICISLFKRLLSNYSDARSFFSASWLEELFAFTRPVYRLLRRYVCLFKN